MGNLTRALKENERLKNQNTGLLEALKRKNGQLEEYIGKEVILGVRPELIHDEERYLEQFADSTIDAKVATSIGVRPMASAFFIRSSFQ